MNDKVLEEMSAHLENLVYLKEKYLQDGGFELDKIIDFEMNLLNKRIEIYKKDSKSLGDPNEKR